MGIRVHVGVMLAVILTIGLAGCTESTGTFVDPSVGSDPGWLQFRIVHETAAVEAVDTDVSEAGAATLDEVWQKVGPEAAELAQSLTQAPTDPGELAVLEPFSQLTAGEVELLPIEVRLNVPLIHCDQLKPSAGFFAPDEEAVACEPAGEDTEKLHLGPSELNGTHVAVASGEPTPHDPAQYQVVLEMTDGGATRLSDLTAEHVDERLAILLADDVVIAPVIQGRISDGVVQIAGGFTYQEAEDLARIINSATKVAR